MTTRLQRYVDELYAVVEQVDGFPAAVERSTLRAFRRDEHPMLVIHQGREVISPDSAWPRSTRVRELLCTVHTAGAERDTSSEEVFEALQPIVIGYVADGLVQIEELGTDEPKYLQGDLDRMAVTKRFRLTYQTLDDSLSA